MLTRNVDEILARLAPDDLVLDVGGWACPFNRAQWILDAEPYENRGFYRTFGGPQKLHMIHERRFSLPERYRRRLTEESSVQWLFWKGAFTWEETTILGVPAQEAELSRFARSIWRRPGWLEGLDTGWRWTAAFSRRAAGAIRRRL